MEYRLEELFNLQMGKTPSRNNPEYWNSQDNKWISIGDLSKCDKYIFDTKEYISDSAVKDSGISIIPSNTVIMSFKLSIGKTAITPEPMYSNEAIMSFRDKKIVELLPDYIYYMFSGMNWENGTNKAVMGKTLNKATLSQIRVRIHSIDEQREIVSALDKLQSIITHRRTQLEKLDELIKARFVEMFGDPEFNNYNWDTFKMAELCTVSSSKRVYQSELTNEGVPFLRISDLVNRMDYNTESCDLFISEEKYNDLLDNGLVPKKDDILVTARGTLGRCYIVKDTDRFYFQDGMITWLSGYSEKIVPVYISYLFSMQGIKKQIEEMQAGSTVAYLSIAMTKKLNIMLPPLELQNQFVDFVKQTDKSKVAVQKALDEAQLLFDSLMQEYFG